MIVTRMATPVLFDRKLLLAMVKKFAATAVR